MMSTLTICTEGVDDTCYRPAGPAEPTMFLFVLTLREPSGGHCVELNGAREDG